MDHTALALLALGASGVGVVLAALTLRTAPERVTLGIALLAVAVATTAALTLTVSYFVSGGVPTGQVLYQWGLPGLGMQIGILVDSLSVLMLTVVTVVSLLVHIYSIGYMRGDDGRARFFCYLALFTFAMLLLVLADNFLLLFIGWEGVGVASWLLIGFWYTRERAAQASLKAFLINRLGDFGFLLAICAVFATVGSLDYASSFAAADDLAAATGPGGVSWLTFICLLLFFGAMGKSAQMPLHAWLPDSMEGPTPISAMIHAATMVTAGIFMVARLSPLYEHSAVALSAMLMVGATTALATGLLGLVANDIKRVLAYSTLSQLGYMVAALGVSAYAASIFHLFTHAFFKALLFLAAGSVIIALHHEQDLRRMGGLARKLPMTTLCFAVGALALIGMPGFAGFFSKESIIEAVAHSTVPGAEIALLALLAGVVVTALYMLRLWSMAFMGQERVSVSDVHEPDWSVRGPLVVLAVLTLVSPLAMEALLIDAALADALFVAVGHDTLAALTANWQGLIAHTTHAVTTLPVLLLGGAIAVWLIRPLWARLAAALTPQFVVRALENQYGFDTLYERTIPRLALKAGTYFAQTTDRRLIDGALVMGAAHTAQRVAARLRRVHTGLLNHYAFVMLLGLALAIGYLLFEV